MRTGRHTLSRGQKASLALVAFFMACSVAMMSCSSINCPVQNTVRTQFAIYDNKGEANFVDSLWVWTERQDGIDTLLLNALTGKSTFTLPISYMHPEDQLIFFIADTSHVQTIDTIWLKKDDIPHFESVDCAAHFFHQLTAVRSTHYGIDSVTIVNSLVNYDQNKTHLRIYFKARH